MSSTALSPLNTSVTLTVGQLFYWDSAGKPHSCVFQFNPTELERSRTIRFTRSPTGNTLEEPGAGPRNQAKRKFTRKPEPWTMTLALRFDAGYGTITNAASSPLPPLPAQPPDPPPPRPVSFKGEIERVAAAMQFFEALVEPGPFVSENENAANADETPPPPRVVLAYGTRSWLCAVKSCTIKEQDYTIDLYPRRFEVTLGLEIIETLSQNLQGKTGGVR